MVNDTCGHLVGDEMLKQITALLRSRVRRSDTLARLGGDEFGVLLEDCPLDQARADRRGACAAPCASSASPGATRSSRSACRIGLVPIDADSGDLAQVMSAADAACYVAKDSGRNRVHEYELDDTLVAERYGEMQWIHRIHARLRGPPLPALLPAHPAARPGAPAGELLCEVFLRMLDDDGKVVEPAVFIAAAERYHLIGSTRPLGGAHRLPRPRRGAAARGRRGRSSSPSTSRRQSLSEESFLDLRAARSSRRARVDPRRICFEITETAAISKLDSAMRFIAGAQGRRAAASSSTTSAAASPPSPTCGTCRSTS